MLNIQSLMSKNVCFVIEMYFFIFSYTSIWQVYLLYDMIVNRN